MHILVSNVYSWQNKGDAAIVLSMLEHLSSEFPNAKIALSTQDPLDAGKYGDCECLPSFISLLKTTYGADDARVTARFRFALAYLSIRLRLVLFRLGMRIGLRSYWIFPRPVAKKVRSYEQFDLVIACGGGYLLTKERPRKLESLLCCHHLMLLSDDFYCATLFGKPFILYNQSIGPFRRKVDARKVRDRLSHAKAVICREELTLDRLRDLGLDNLLLCSDAAFNLPAAHSSLLTEYGFDRMHVNIGITVRSCLPPRQQRSYEEELARFIDLELDENEAMRFFFMPQVIFEKTGDNDGHVSMRIAACVSEGNRSRVAVVIEDLHPAELKSVIGQMDYFVGTRMHSNIFALSSGVKTLAISYDLKTDGVMSMLGLSDYVIPAHRVTASRLAAMFRKLSGDREYVVRLTQRISEVQARCRPNLGELLNQQTAERNAIGMERADTRPRSERNR